MMKEKVGYFAFGFSLLLIVSCTSRKSLNPDNISDVDSIAITDSIHPDSLHHPLPDEFMDGHTPPPPPPDGKHFDGPPPPPLMEKAVLPISRIACAASTLHRKMTWRTTVWVATWRITMKKGGIKSQIRNDSTTYSISDRCGC